MHKSLIVVEDFYNNPLEVRAAALSLGFPEHQGPRTFPGRNSAGPLVTGELDQVVSALLGEPLRATPAGGSFHGYCRATLAGEEGRYRVHVDPSALWWVGVCYLTLPEHCQGGTSFYRHKALGLDRTPTQQAEIEAVGVPGVAELLARDGTQAEAWEELMTLPMRFNRAIFYRPWLWHSAGPGFGTTPEDGRLIQVFAFQQG
ncbi:MAG: hypothetical protein Kilf2KO_16990 [Rhodospirillales bacterium]